MNAQAVNLSCSDGMEIPALEVNNMHSTKCRCDRSVKKILHTYAVRVNGNLKNRRLIMGYLNYILVMCCQFVQDLSTLSDLSEEGV